MKNSIEILERDLIRTMGFRVYEETKAFYKHVYESDVTKVIVEGRAYALYKIFESIFEADVSLKRGGKVYTTHAISQMAKGQQKVLLVADVIEDEKSVLAYINKLSNLNVVTLDNIVVWCIAVNTKLDVKYIKPYFKHVIYMMPDDIRRLSITLSKAVMGINVGYLSFVNSYRLKKLTFEDISRVNSRQLIENDLQSFSDVKIISKVLWRDFLPENVISTYDIKSCIRFYQRELGEMIAIPYVFLPSLKADKVCEYCKGVLSILGLSYPHSIETDREMLYKWTIYSVSKLIFKIFIDENKDETEKWDYDIIDYSEEFFGISQNVRFVKSGACSYDGYQIAKHEVDMYCHEYRLFCECLTWKKSLPDAINLYLYLTRANNKKGKGDLIRQGLMVSDVLTLGKEYLFSQDEILSEVIRCLDCEKLVISIGNNQDNSIFDAFLCRGKHSQVGYYNEMHKKVYGVHYSFFARTNDSRPASHLKFAMFLDEKLGTNEFSDFAIHFDEDENIFTDFASIEPVSKTDELMKSYMLTFVEYYYKP